MELGLDKCAKCTFVHEKTKRTDNISIDQSTTIQELENEASYKYLGLREDGPQVQHKRMCKIISKEYLHRIRLILKSSLSLRNKTKAINQLAVPVFQYSCAIINWTQLEINNPDTKTMKLLTIHNRFHKNQSMLRLYLPRRGQRRGLMELNQEHRTSCEGLAEHVKI